MKIIVGVAVLEEIRQDGVIDGLPGLGVDRVALGIVLALVATAIELPLPGIGQVTKPGVSAARPLPVKINGGDAPSLAENRVVIGLINADAS